MDIEQTVELAKQGSRLSSDKQWILADALAELTDTEISQVAIESGRNESTLHQYARAAERWDELDRVEGVTFSAHRVALSWTDPRQLLLDLKSKYGSPTVSQVRQAMGLEGHPALELIERGIRKLDRAVSADALAKAIAKLLKYHAELNAVEEAEEVLAANNLTPEQLQEAGEEAQTLRKEDVDPDTDTDSNTGTWTPPIRATDIQGA